MTMIRKTLTMSLAALTIGATVFATSAPASAHGWHPGWHHGGIGWGPAAAIGIGALAVGAIAASNADYGDCYITRRAVVDAYGNVIGSRRVRVCD